MPKAKRRWNESSWWLVFQARIIIKKMCVWCNDNQEIWKENEAWEEEWAIANNWITWREEMCWKIEGEGMLSLSMVKKDNIWAKQYAKILPLSENTWTFVDGVWL